MSFTDALKKNAFSQLLLRIFRHFDNVPPNISIEYYRFYIISNIGYTLGWMIHLNWFIIFLSMGQYGMARIQPISIAAHVVAILLNRRGRHNAAMVVGMTEVVAHQIAATYLLGWDAGFQYIIAAITLFPFLKHDGSRVLKSALVLLCMTSYGSSGIVGGLAC